METIKNAGECKTGVQQELISKEIGLKFCGGSEELYKDILSSYCEEGYKYLKRLDQFWEEKNWKDYGIAAHAIKSTSMSIGAISLSELAKKSELAAIAEDRTVISENHARLIELIEQVLYLAEALCAKEEELVLAHINKPEYLKKTILVIDDDRTNLTIAQKLLSKHYRVDTVKSGKEGLEYLEKYIPSLILLDIQMPEMNGYEVMDVLRIHESWCKIPVIFLTADRSSEAEEKCFDMGAADYIGKPFVPQIMIKRVTRTIELEEYRKSLEKMVVAQLNQITRMQHDVIVAMANVIESRDGTTGEHIKRTGIYTMLLAGKMLEEGLYTETLTVSFLEHMRNAAALHDIGKITIPDAVLTKPGKLTFEEYETVKTHAKAGADMIRKNMNHMVSSEFLQIACDMAQYHHEKWNGKGYPEELKGQDIPLSARILAVADVFDALVSKRQYKEGMTIEQAFDIMAADRGKSFEPEILDVFFGLKTDLERLIAE